MSTAPPTTVAPTTLAPTTEPPTNVVISDVQDLWGKPWPITLTLSLDYGGWKNVGLAPTHIPINVTLSGSMDTGETISLDGEPTVTVSLSGMMVVETVADGESKANFIKWSKIGELDFTIDNSNLAGERPLDWRGAIWHVAKLGKGAVAYGKNGVTILTPHDRAWGINTIRRVGLKNKGAFAGNDSIHFFVDSAGRLWKLTDGLEKLDYAEFLSTMGTVILSLDSERMLLYITDGTSGYVYGVDSNSLGECAENITGLGSQSGVLYVTSDGEIDTPKFNICTDVYDLGTRRPKTIRTMDLGTNTSEYLRVAVDYKTSYKKDFRQSPWFIVNPSGKAFPTCYGVEFRFRIKSMIYEYFELDYMRLKFDIHGFGD